MFAVGFDVLWLIIPQFFYALSLVGLPTRIFKEKMEH
jgi:hypothetical protein